jgi:hypothetical protein
MGSLTMEPRVWAEEQFGACQLGDKRRTKRLIQVAAQVAADPSASFPEQAGSWSDLKAAYRLFDQEGVSFDAIAEPHWQQTRARCPGRYLVLGDTTELDFGIERQIPGLGPTGNGGGYGFLLHSGLLVGAESEEIFGLTAQVIHYRKPAPKRENTSQRLKRERESELCGKVIDGAGSAPMGAQFIHVLERGADNFEVFCHAREQGAGWVVRATQLGRNIVTPGEKKRTLRQYLGRLPVAGNYELYLRARPNQPTRWAKLEVRYGAVTMLVPKQKSRYVLEQHPAPVAMWVIWVREVDAPRGAEAIEWVLYTSEPINSFEDACRVVGYYEKRWLIEEWHKALKTGCRVTHRQLKAKARLEAMMGLMSVEAVRLVQLKAAARTEPHRPAEEFVPLLWVMVLMAIRRLPTSGKLTVGEFYREMAKLGGFLGRKNDGEPGWITIWRGWGKLYLLVRGSDLAAQLRPIRKNCG